MELTRDRAVKRVRAVGEKGGGMSEQREDDYGNPLTEDGELVDGRLIYCTFPDCGCDGERLCMAENGASENACKGNVEGMYRRTDKEAMRGRMELLRICGQRRP
jgi:hypothetical protein